MEEEEEEEEEWMEKTDIIDRDRENIERLIKVEKKWR